jgi:membrane protein implicated in regulation of membrane protease activity
VETIVNAITAIALLVGAIAAAIFVRKRGSSRMGEHKKVAEILKDNEARVIESAKAEHGEVEEKIEADKEEINNANLDSLAGFVNEAFDE